MESTMISRKALAERLEPNFDGLSSYILKRCVQLEAALENWFAVYRPRQILEPDNEKTAASRQAKFDALVNHHTLPFYEAIMVYHYRVARNKKVEDLQSNVQCILGHLESLISLSFDGSTAVDGDPVILPALFTGFIGAFEVDPFDQLIYQRYDRNLHRIESFCPFQYGYPLKKIQEVRARRKLGG